MKLNQVSIIVWYFHCNWYEKHRIVVFHCVTGIYNYCFVSDYNGSEIQTSFTVTYLYIQGRQSMFSVLAQLHSSTSVYYCQNRLKVWGWLALWSWALKLTGSSCQRMVSIYSTLINSVTAFKTCQLCQWVTWEYWLVPVYHYGMWNAYAIQTV